MKTPRLNNRLFDKAKGVKLDVGCGAIKQKGFLGMDIEPGPLVDIVHDIQKFPWPVPKDICSMILASHVFEHIEPKYRFQFMDECWRIIKPDGQLWIACPYANSVLAMAHPAHYPCPNEAAFEFFDPDYRLWHCAGYKKPLPWKIVRLAFELSGCIEIVLEPRKTDKGKIGEIPKEPKNFGSVQFLERKQPETQVLWPKKKGRKEHGRIR